MADDDLADGRPGRVLKPRGQGVHPVDEGGDACGVPAEIGIEDGRHPVDRRPQGLQRAGSDHEGSESGQPDVVGVVAASLQFVALPDRGLGGSEDAAHHQVVAAGR